MSKIEKICMSNVKDGKPYMIKTTFDVESKVNEIIDWINSRECEIAKQKLKQEEKSDN